MKIVMLAVDQIDVGDRLRPIDEDYAALIGASMAQLGQRAPIEVMAQNGGGKYSLISGGHRLRGAVIAGMEDIAAIVRDVTDLQAELLEVDENLTRYDLNEMDRAVFIERRKSLYEDLYPQTKSAGNWAKKTNDKFVVCLESFSEATAEKLGCSVRSVERAVARARNIVPTARLMIGTSWIARRGSYLDAIAKLEAAEQRAVVALLLEPTEDGTEMSVADAIRVVRKVPEARQDPVHDAFWKIKAAWEKAGRNEPEAQAKFLKFIGAKITGGRS